MMQIAPEKHPTRQANRMLAGLCVLVMLTSFSLPRMAASQAATNRQPAADSATEAGNQVTYLPYVGKSHNYLNVFGVESLSAFYPDNLITNYTTGMHANTVRMNDRISWRALQPEEGGPINWGLLAGFELELRTLKAANIDPIIVVDNYPYWATDNTVRLDGLPTSCGPLRADRYDDFAVFMQELVSRYSRPEFDAHIWEMGNEPDVDPNLLPVDSHYGCWGDWDDPFYNGRAYGEMLKIVSPAVKAVDPLAQVWVGGLLLNSPNTIDDHIGQPEDFFRGILEARAAPYIDAVSYHAYTHFSVELVDGDLNFTTWVDWGGIIRGKARFLRGIMNEYNVDEPLYLTETSHLCAWCPDYRLPYFYDQQADLAPRAFPRAMEEGISGFLWYTLEGPGWNNCGLLDGAQVPRPAYYAFQTLIEMVGNAGYIGTAAYGDGIEAYTFYKGAARIDIIFATEANTYSIYVPRSIYLAAYDRFGTPITPTPFGSDYTLNIQFEPIYLVRQR